MVSLEQGLSNPTIFGDGRSDDWIFISSNTGLKSAAQQGAENLRNMISTINDIKERVISYGSAFANGIDSIENALSYLSTAQNTLDRIAGDPIEDKISAFNDNLESARAKGYLKYLREVCQNYNDTNQNIVQETYTVAGPTPESPDETRTVRAQGWVNGRFIPIPRYQCKIVIDRKRDKIEYDWGIDGFIDSSGWKVFNFFDLDANEMVLELEKRGYNREKLERPRDTSSKG